MKSSLHLAILAAFAASGSVFAADAPAGAVQRDVNQQERIEQGLKSGELNTKEAGKLERQETHVDKMEARDLKDGKVSPAEQARLNAAQNKVSGDIYKQKHDAQTGNPNSASSQRMQHDVQRNVNQQTRIEQGVKSGSLSNREAGRLERGQAHVDHKEALAARNGRVGAAEQRSIRRSENHQSRRILRKKTN